MTITMPKWCAVLMLTTINVMVPVSFVIYLWKSTAAFSDGVVVGICICMSINGLKNVWQVVRKYLVSE